MSPALPVDRPDSAGIQVEVTASETEQINEFLGLNSETTSLTTEDIFKGVREIASRQP